jgi:hypothetical protein
VLLLPGTPAHAAAWASARPLRHGRGPMPAVPSCAGAYVSGDRGSNACPAGSVRIEAEAACRTAAAAAGKTPSTSSRFPFVETESAFPRGCYYTSANDAFFNTHAVGAGHSNSQLLCAALATTGAPLKRRRRTGARRACTGARACRHRACAARHSRAVCAIHGAHIDAHTYIIGIYTHIYIYPYDADGARRRCRTAAQADGRARARKGTQRVLEHGYSNTGTQKVFKKGTQTGVLKKTPPGRGPT